MMTATKRRKIKHATTYIALCDRSEVYRVLAVSVSDAWVSSFLDGFRAAAGRKLRAKVISKAEATAYEDGGSHIWWDFPEQHLLDDAEGAAASGACEAVNRILLAALHGLHCSASVHPDRFPGDSVRYHLGVSALNVRLPDSPTPEKAIDVLRETLSEVAEALAKSRK